MREIPRKNYIYLGLLTIIVILICFLLMNAYNKNSNKIYESVVKEVVSEIKYDDLENYLQENPDVVIYIYDNTKKVNSVLEKDIKELLTKYHVQQYFVYMEKSELLARDYDLNSNNPIFIAYKDGKVSEILSKKEYKIKDIRNFLIRNEVIEND